MLFGNIITGSCAARHRVRKAVFAQLVCTLLLAGCVTTTANVAPLTSGDHKFAATPEEKHLLELADRAYAEFDRKGMLYEDVDLQSYLDRVAATMVPPETAGVVKFRFRIVRMPVANAFAMPNGDIYFTVALLARLESEAQLAQVLAHEIGHVVLRHSLKENEARRNSLVAAHIADLMLFGTSIAYLPHIIGTASFSREQEQEADAWGMDRLTKAGYSPSAALQAFAAVREIKKTEEIEGSAYSSHPSSQQRRDALAARIAAVPEPTQARVGAEDYQAFRRRVMAENIQLKLNVRQYEGARDAADVAAAAEPKSPWPAYYKGEAYRMMGEDPKGAAREHAWLYGDKDVKPVEEKMGSRRDEFFEEAEKSYRQALAGTPGFTLADRGLGILCLRRGDKDGARSALSRYLNSDKNIKDRQYIANLLKGMEQ